MWPHSSNRCGTGLRRSRRRDEQRPPGVLLTPPLKAGRGIRLWPASPGHLYSIGQLAGTPSWSASSP
jgi:hypothetical protein